MDNFLSYLIHQVTDSCEEFDDSGDPLPEGWYYQIDGTDVWVGPFITSWCAEDAADAELEDILYAN